MTCLSEYFPKNPPFNGTPRPGQMETIEKIFAALENGKRMFVLNAPTGTGKSAIVYTIARAVNERLVQYENSGTIITTSQKILQDQYVEDFPDIAVMKGRSNYPCEMPLEGEEPNCDNGVCTIPNDEVPPCKFFCPYDRAKNKAIMTPIVTMNTAYFIGESNTVNKFGRRKLLVIDEAHNVEGALMSYIECGISDNLLRVCKIDDTVPNYQTFDRYYPWLKQLQEKSIDVLKRMEDAGVGNEASVFKRLERFCGKLSFLMFNANTAKWVADYDKIKKKVVFKPIDVSAFARSMFFSFGDIIVMCSATISKRYVRDCLGIPEEDFEYLEMDSTFPVENRPIVPLNVGRMGFQYIDKTLPKIVENVDKILARTPDKKGIIHATSYKIARYIEEHTQFKDRLITHDSANRMEKLEEHIKSDQPTVILSPSMTEGVDLKYGLARFQIVCKIPFASIGDKQIKARMEIDKVWYANLAATTLMQAYGRGVRAADDTCATFILDSGFGYFLKSNGDLFPKWFKEAVMI